MKGRVSLPKLVLNVPAVAHQPPEMVERILGRPGKTSGAIVSQNQKVAYRGGKVEVVYVDGKASWIKLYDTQQLTFDRQSLSRLGLPPQKPTYVNRNHVMSWSQICNLREVSFYSDSGGGISSVLVCANSQASEQPDGPRPAPRNVSARSFWSKLVKRS